MLAPLTPPDEEQRLAALYQLKILDTAPEERFNRLIRLAHSMFQTPIVALSLVDRNRQWFKASIGLDDTETARETSFCGHTILGDDILYIPDALADERFADNPLVIDAPNIRSYAGAPLHAQGQRVGSLCVIDSVPRQYSAEQLRVLRDLADAVEQQFALHDAVQAVRAYQSQQVRLNAVFDSVADGVCIIDERNVVLSSNLACAELFGCIHQELKGHALTEFLAADSHERYRACLQATEHGKAMLQLLGWRKGGVSFHVEMTASRMFSEEHQLFVVVMRDISERLAAERQLRDLQLSQQTILDNAAAAIVSMDAQGLIRTFSKGAERMFGYQAAELIGKQTLELLHDPEESLLRTRVLAQELGQGVQPGLDTYTLKVRQGHPPTETEWQYVRKDGSRFPGLATLSAIRDSAGEVTGFIAIVNDITERQHLDRMKSEFVSTVSHELRTPLTSIRGALGLVLGKAADGLSPKARQLLETANRNSERLTLLINDILDLEKIESGRMEFNLLPVDLVAISRQALQAHEGYADRHQVSLSLQEPGQPVMVLGDEHRLMQVYANLLSNAIKYSPAQGEVQVVVQLEGQRVRVSVRDHGRGIPDAFRKAVFQRFAQADSSDTREKGGTGLGLSIAKAIVERHQGSIDYHSVLGEGTEFYFDVPVAKGLLSARGQRGQAPLANLLVCEPNTAVAEVFSRLLATEQVSCEVVGSGSAVLAALQNPEAAYDALLLDVAIPDIDGLTLLGQLRANPATRSLPIIVVSGKPQQGATAQGSDALCVVDWLHKPIDKSRLAEALRRALHHEKRPRILHVEDEADILQITHLLVEDLADHDHAATLADARRLLAEHRYDLVLLDLTLPDGHGLELINEIDPGMPVLVFSGQESDSALLQQVNAALTKSKTSNERLLATIKTLLNLS